MKKMFLFIVLLLICSYIFSQDNYFTFNGFADVKLRCLSRGIGGRSIVHWDNNTLVLNFGGDFTGGTQIHSPLLVRGNLNVNASITGNKLDINGTIRSKEVKIEATGWSDFVFNKDYQLPTLQAVEQHINDKGHLPDIPSEKEVIKNGISVGEMQAKLLQKIEELTLYVIDLKKENESIKQELKGLRKE
ncbi:MAG: hypothetical protein LBS20_05560 [Prevotella sp.]|jgi:hypothetical protein|nr:hypothetical protein [Prevotella sp.]